MQVEHLHYLLDIYNMRSISATAHYLHIAQTTLSTAVKSVEDELGFPIFKRTPFGVAPTEKGQRVLDLAWKVTSRYESLMSLKDRSGEAPQFFNIPVSPVLPPYILSGIAEKFSQFQSFGNICFEEYPSKEIGAAVAERMAGIGIAILTKQQFFRLQDSYSPSALNVELLYDDTLACIVPMDSPLATQPYANIEEIQKLHLVLPYAPLDSTTIGRELASFLSNYSILPDISLLLAGVVQHGYSSILPYKTVKQEISILKGQCRAIPIRREGYDPSVCACMCLRPFDRLNRQERFAYSCIRNFCDKMEGTFPCPEEEE